jgi:hypothetical protein
MLWRGKAVPMVRHLAGHREPDDVTKNRSACPQLDDAGNQRRGLIR